MATADVGQTRSTAIRLVEMAESRFTFATSQAGEPIAIEMDGPNVARPLRGGRYSLRAELASCFANTSGAVANSSALADALMVLEGRAQARDVVTHLRVARHGGDLVLDLGDQDGRAVVVSPGRWTVVSRSPVLFRRTELTSALPEPVRGGSLEALRLGINVTDETWPLLVAFLVSSLVEDIPHPVLALLGEHGTGKSTTAKRLAEVFDVSPAPLRAAPRDLHDWSVAAAGSWCVPLDNVSAISPWLSDAICRAATGDGLVKRRLYADDALVVLSFRRVVMLTSIDPGALRGDLGDRLLIAELERIPANRRRLDGELATTWSDAHGQILGALLDLAAHVLAVLPTISLTDYPRMADFARIASAVDEVLGTNALETYSAQATRVAEDIVDADLVAQAIREIAGVGWRGTAQELHTKLTPDRAPKGWPTSARALAGQVRRAAPALRELGVSIEFSRSGHDRQRLITITTEETLEQPSAPSAEALTVLSRNGLVADGTEPVASRSM
jgi:hypothetical protein